MAGLSYIISVMIYAALVLLGLCFGSFVNALVWRLHEHKDWVKGRSICVHCKHALAAKDLVPVVSWLWLQGRCRYCHKPIAVQYPVVESATALLFVGSYAFWPVALTGSQVAVFALWLVLMVGLMALLVYDLRWMLLPDKLIFPLIGVAVVQALIVVFGSSHSLRALVNVVLAVAIGGGLFYVLFQVSGGKWIGGGDVKLGWLLGIIAGTPGRSLLLIFLAAVLGSLVSLPLLASKRLKPKSVIPFGPFLILGVIIVVLFGGHILDWYEQLFTLGV